MKRIEIIRDEHNGIGRVFIISDEGVQEFECWYGLTVDIEEAIEKALGCPEEGG